MPRLNLERTGGTRERRNVKRKYGMSDGEERKRERENAERWKVRAAEESREYGGAVSFKSLLRTVER